MTGAMTGAIDMARAGLERATERLARARDAWSRTGRPADYVRYLEVRNEWLEAENRLLRAVSGIEGDTRAAAGAGDGIPPANVVRFPARLREVRP